MIINFHSDGGMFYQADLSIWFFRWSPPATTARHVVTTMWPGLIRNHEAVVDDFGRLVTVPANQLSHKEYFHG